MVIDIINEMLTCCVADRINNKPIYNKSRSWQNKLWNAKIMLIPFYKQPFTCSQKISWHLLCQCTVSCKTQGHRNSAVSSTERRGLSCPTIFQEGSEMLRSPHYFTACLGFRYKVYHFQNFAERLNVFNRQAYFHLNVVV